MSVRARLLISFGVVVLIPLLVFGLGIRSAMSRRVKGEYERRVSALVDVIRGDIARENDRSATRLAALRGSLVGDSKFRAMVLRGEDSAYVLDYASDAMRLAGLGYLQIQDDEGRVVSSGHFRSEFGRLGPAIPPGGPTLVRGTAAEAAVLALVNSDTLSVTRKPFRRVSDNVRDSPCRQRIRRRPIPRIVLLLPRHSNRAAT